jgi:hypothetical protein
VVVVLPLPPLLHLLLLLPLWLLPLLLLQQNKFAKQHI